MDPLYVQTKEIAPFQFEKRSLLDPPPFQKPSSMPLMLALGPSFTMGLASMSTALFTVQQALVNHSSMTTVYPSLIMAVSMMAGTMIWPLIIQKYEKRRDKEKETKRQAIYHQYLRNTQQQIDAELQRYQTWLWLFHPRNVEALPKQPENLWKVIPQSDDILCLGLYEQPITLPIQFREHDLVIDEDPLIKERDAFLQRSRSVSHVPFYLSLSKHLFIYVLGNQTQRHAYAMYLILHICLLYPPQHIHLVFAMTSVSALPDSFRFLPHLFDKEGNRSLCLTQKDVQNVILRVQRQKQHAIVCSFSPMLSAGFHFEQEARMKFTILAFHCQDKRIVSDAQIQLNDVEGIWSQKDQKISFQWQPIAHPEQLAMFLNRLSIADDATNTFPKQLSFLELYQVEKVHHLQIWKQWQNSQSEHTLSALLGVNERGEPIALDLHEKAHGPHGIIAGMTGFGKSELLITLILSLAVTYHPDDVSFILIDYKGGGMAKAFENLPHVAGIITNLDGSMIQRSLNSLDSELMRRQTIFSETMKELQVSSMDIYLYQKFYHEKRVEEPLPHLVIVADEFAELKQQQPQFMEQLIRTARIGRSLGVHLLLATQKPSGVVDDQIWSNARFHICLKVAEKADSMDMLKREDGALLSDTGRFFLQVGYNEIFQQGQSAYTKALYQPEGNSMDSYVRQIDAGAAVLQEWKRPITKTQKHAQLQAVIEHMATLAQMHHLTVRQLWLPPLPDTIHVSMKSKTIAMIDDPNAQAQYPLKIQLSKLSSCIAFGMNLKEIETLFQTVMIQLMAANAPSQLKLLIYDFEQNHLLEMRHLPHVYAAVCEEEEEDLHYLFTYLQKEIKERKKHKKQQTIMIVLHHIAAFLETNEYYEPMLYKLMRDGSRYGIYLWISATTLQDVRFRIQQQCSQFFLFKLHDEQEASTLLNAKKLFPDIKGRAIWKSQEQMYEVQIATVDLPNAQTVICAQYADEMFEKLLPLPEHVFFADIWKQYDATYPNRLPIGMNIQQRQIQWLDLQQPWLLIGTRHHPFIRVLKQAVSENISFTWVSEDTRTMSDQGLYLIEKEMLSQFLYQPWFQTMRNAGTILWLGDGLSEARYLLDLTREVPACKATQGYILSEDIQMVALMEDTQ